MLVLLVTVALNCCVWPALKLAVAGVTAMDAVAGGLTVMMALALTLELDINVAFAVTFCCALIVAGAVYRPAVDKVPTTGLSDQLTAPPLLGVAVNCWVCPALTVAEVGVTEMVGAVGGFSVTLAVAVIEVLAASVAVIVTVCTAAMVAGAA